MNLIDKDAAIAEIERRIKDLYPKGGQGMVVTKILKDHYEDFLSFINTLEVKEVNLEKEPTSEDLEDVANKYGKDTFVNECMGNGICDNNDLADAFKAGARWQRERMMKEAKDATIRMGRAANFIEMSWELDDYLQTFHSGQKVKIIIVKED